MMYIMPNLQNFVKALRQETASNFYLDYLKYYRELEWTNSFYK